MNKPDPEVDFDGWVSAQVADITAKVERETKGMTPEQMKLYWLESSLKQLHRLCALNAPSFLIKQQLKLVRKRASTFC